MTMQSLSSWQPDCCHSMDYLSQGQACRLAAMLDKPDNHFHHGTVLPELWHWLYFLPSDKQSDLATDGHPEKGAFLPPVALPRRMWASSRMRWHAPFRIGENIEKSSRVQKITEKQGRTGKLVFVDVAHQYASGQMVLLDEIHTIVYRDAPDATAVHASGRMNVTLPEVQFSSTVVPDPRLLFRYSALTFNTHRIHYDLAYATQEEGYPGLIVHGPLTATLLIDLLKNHYPQATIESLHLGAFSPLFCSAPITLCGHVEGQTATLWAAAPDGSISMKATAMLHEGSTL